MKISSKKEMVIKLRKFGLTMSKISKIFKRCPRTIYNWLIVKIDKRNTKLYLVQI